MEEQLDKEFYIYEEDGITKISVIDYISGIIVAIPFHNKESSSHTSLAKVKAATKVNQILSEILSDLEEKE